MTSPNTTALATSEYLLRQVIEAQVRGGCKKWPDVSSIHESGLLIDERGNVLANHVLQILLDTQGCKAAYPGLCSSFGGLPGEGTIATSDLVPLWPRVADKIHKAWHSGEGNSVRAALETAVSFLPKA